MTFTLYDAEQILDPETHHHLAEAVARANNPVWAGRPWTIVDHDGRERYTHRYPKGT